MLDAMQLKAYPLLAVLLVVFVSAGCDNGNPVMNEPEPEPGPSLDEQLVEIITIGGQRGLSNFTLPASDDFAAIPQDPGNPLSAAKVELGKLLFHETALATNPVRPEGLETYSCATCHHAAAGFQPGILQGLGEGGVGWGARGEGRRPGTGYSAEELDVQAIRTPSVLNAAYQEVMGWAGTFGVRGPNRGTEANWIDGTPSAVNQLGYDGLETQAIASLKTHRLDNIDSSAVISNDDYLQLWEEAFPGEAPSVETVGLAIAAYERTLLANQAPFQRWLRGETNAMTDAEKRGAIVFFAKARCEVCHTGPALNQMDFYALGMPDMEALGEPDELETLGRGAFLQDPTEDYKFKVPQIYNLKDSPFYGHGGSFRTIREVVVYYNDAIPEVSLPDGILTNRFLPLDLTPDEINDLVAFLTEALYDAGLDRYVPGSLPSGNCTPANDAQARADLGC